MAKRKQPQGDTTQSSQAAKSSILVVDDDLEILRLYEAILKKEGYAFVLTSSPKEAIGYLAERHFSVLLSDLRMSELDGLELMQQARLIQPEICVILATAFGSVEGAVEAMRLGAYDYLLKPFMPKELLATLDKAFAFTELVTENTLLKSQLAESLNQSPFVTGSSPAMQKVSEQIDAVAITPATVLIRGESGTGKEMVANEIHRKSQRADKPFIKLNCGAIPENLLEDELFGHEKGAFTGAVANREGKFEAAHGGTIFLDEIGEMAPLLQVKLLRVLQEGIFQRVGGNDNIKVDVRILCATHADLETSIAEGRFRQDLYYRLNVVELYLPPLRHRLDDVPMLTDDLLRRLCVRHAIPRKKISQEAVEMLLQHPFPGNVRELQNALEHALVFSKGDVLTPGDFPMRLSKRQDTHAGFGAWPVQMTLDELECQHVELIGKQHAFDRKAMAEHLGLTRTALSALLKKHRIKPS